LDEVIGEFAACGELGELLKLNFDHDVHRSFGFYWLDPFNFLQKIVNNVSGSLKATS
jgi:hypothetical protein